MMQVLPLSNKLLEPTLQLLQVSEFREEAILSIQQNGSSIMTTMLMKYLYQFFIQTDWLVEKQAHPHLYKSMNLLLTGRK